MRAASIAKFNERITQLITLFCLCTFIVISHRRLGRERKSKNAFTSVFNSTRRLVKIHEMFLWLFSLKGITFHCRGPFGSLKGFFAALMSTNSKWKFSPSPSQARAPSAARFGNWKLMKILFNSFIFLYFISICDRLICCCSCAAGCLRANFNRSSCRSINIYRGLCLRSLFHEYVPHNNNISRNIVPLCFQPINRRSTFFSVRNFTS